MPYLTIRVAGLSTTDFDGIDTEFDNGDGATAGRIRRTGTGTAGDPYLLNFLAIPLD